MNHVFIFYVREDSEQVQLLCNDLKKNGIEVWLDKDNITVGTNFKSAIQKAIENGAFFLTCFSTNYYCRDKTYMNLELDIAIDVLKMYRRDRPWFIPVLFSNCKVPAIPINNRGETIADFQWIELYSNWDDGIRKICEVIKPMVDEEIIGDLERTKAIVNYMKDLLKTPESIQNLEIRHQAGFSSLSNLDFKDTTGRENDEWLEKERDLLIEIIEKGARLKVILRPPFHPHKFDERWLQRYNKLLQFLCSKQDYLNRCEFVIDYTRANNLFFFGDKVLFEGTHIRVNGNYELTYKYTDSSDINKRIQNFDKFFLSARRQTLEDFGKENESMLDSSIALRQAVIRGIEQGKTNLQKLDKKTSYS
jgi:hypothetical protein